MKWIIKTDRPVYIQLMEQIQQKVLCGEYPLGSRLPSVRDLASEAEVNPNTMQKALMELERTGLVYAKRTSGRFITEDEGLVMDIRETLAQMKMTEFIHEMEQLGFTVEEICRILQKIEKENIER